MAIAQKKPCIGIQNKWNEKPANFWPDVKRAIEKRDMEPLVSFVNEGQNGPAREVTIELLSNLVMKGTTENREVLRMVREKSSDADVRDIANGILNGNGKRTGNSVIRISTSDLGLNSGEIRISGDYTAHVGPNTICFTRSGECRYI